MNCRLCGQPKAGPDKMCGDCGRALKRAREGSAALRSLSGAPAQVESPSPPPIEMPPQAPANPPARKGRRIAAYCAIGLVGIGSIVFAMRAPDRAGASGPQLQGSAASPLVEESVQQQVSAPTLAEPAPVAPADIPTAAVVPTLPAPHRASRGSATPAPANVKPRSNAASANRTALAPKGAAVSAVTAPLNDAPATSTASSETTPQLARAPVATAPAPAPAREAAPSLSSALERCSGEKFIAGVICEQKARLQFCEGKWGQIPECSSKPRVD